MMTCMTSSYGFEIGILLPLSPPNAVYGMAPPGVSMRGENPEGANFIAWLKTFNPGAIDPRHCLPSQNCPAGQMPTGLGDFGASQFEVNVSLQPFA
jgi:hypothetical protein